VKLQLLPTDPAEEARFADGSFPVPMMLAWMGAAGSRALVVGTRLGVFDRLAETPRTADELAAAAGFDPHGTRVLLEALAGFGFLTRSGGRFALTPTVRQWLTAGSPMNIAPMVALMEDIQGWLMRLEEGVRTGEVANFHFRTGDEGWANYRGLLRVSALFQAPVLVQALGLAGPVRVLDVGGGPGHYAIALARANPELSVEILDLEQSAAEGRANAEAAGVADRVTYRVGDVFAADWPAGPFDLVLLSHFLHCLPERRCAEVVGKAAGLLRAGGRVAVHDVFIAEPDGELVADDVTFSLVYFTGTGGRCWPLSAYRWWLEAAGLTVTASDRLPSGAVFVVGVRG
jgi:SAM-dependent methyltransferase